MVSKITLPFPPSVNHYWRHRLAERRVVTYVSTTGVQFRDEVARVIDLCGLTLGIENPVAVRVVLHAPDNRRRDLDNYGGKALLDALTQAGLWKDDSQVKDLHLVWGNNVPQGSCEVTIKPFTEEKE